MPNLTQQATDLIDAFNAWAFNDLDVTPAAVTDCSRTSLPENPRDAMRLISDVHKSFFDRAAGPNFENLDFTTRARKVTDFDPTNDMYPAAADTRAGAKAQATAKAYFQGRPIEVLQPSGTDAASDLNIAFQIALDPQAALIFSFITAPHRLTQRVDEEMPTEVEQKVERNPLTPPSIRSPRRPRRARACPSAPGARRRLGLLTSLA